ncbi:hypothetical protein ACC691_38630, partial [Rhizobium johnstonii]|uniref:hypothetical protein n=1 Tax=Rhizobium johnstonii TaxID=3019933 RepID=UPI003F959BB2
PHSLGSNHVRQTWVAAPQSAHGGSARIAAVTAGHDDAPHHLSVMRGIHRRSEAEGPLLSV